jgi:general secretion pathway protein K
MKSAAEFTLLKSKRCSRCSKFGQSGIALVLVLWIIALLTVIALGLTTTRRSENMLLANQLDGARFRALADAAIHLTVLNLLAKPTSTTPVEVIWLPDRQRHTVIFDGVQLAVEISNDNSRFDLNQVQRQPLVNLLVLAGADAASADTIADAILDWRDADDLTQMYGAEDDDYRSAGKPYGARDGPFESVTELRQVLGMSDALYARLEPDLRVNTKIQSSGRTASGTQAYAAPIRHSTQIETRFASAAVVAALNNLSLDEATLQLLQQETVVPGADAPRPISRGGPYYHIRVIWQQKQGRSRQLEVLVSIAERGQTGFETIWRHESLQVRPVEQAL